MVWLDLVMWTYNSERTLAKCLRSIELAVSKNLINQKIMVDGYSTDDTINIAHKYGWNVYNAEKVGIPFQANQALEKVTAPFFASFEHDIVLNPNWFSYIFPYMWNPKVAVAQGVRIATDHILSKIELDALRHPHWAYSSLDNTIYHTETIRKLGGFSTSHPASADRELQNRVRREGYTWVVDRIMVSRHMRGSLKDYAHHVYESSSREERQDVLAMLRRFAASPVIAYMMAIRQRCPQLIYGYPYLRYWHLKSAFDKKRIMQ